MIPMNSSIPFGNSQQIFRSITRTILHPTPHFKAQKGQQCNSANNKGDEHEKGIGDAVLKIPQSQLIMF